MKDGSLMNVLFCKIQCPFICFCKPSAAHLYTSSAPLKLENSPHSAFPVDKPSSGVEEEVEKKAETVLKSCIRKPQRGEEEAAGKKKKVEWMDMVMVGKHLAEIKEFDCSETGDTENEEDSSSCVCIIL